MKKIKFIIIPVLVMSIFACRVFLGPDPDNNPYGIFEQVWKDFNEMYALMEFKGIDWNAVYDHFSPQISSGMTDWELFDVLSDMLSVLDDAHVILSSPFAFSNSGGRFDSSNIEPFSLDVVKTYLNGGGTSAGNGMFLYGTFSSNPEIGYIYVAGFAYGMTGIGQSQDWTRDIDVIVQSLEHTSSLVLDIRGNRGGLPSNVEYIASRFVSVQKNYADVRTKNGPGRNDFSSPITMSIQGAGSNYTKPIVLLTNKQTISGGEWFTMALLTQDHVTHAGGTTMGAFSLAIERRLINGWLYNVSIQKITDMNGVCYEGIGIKPEHEVTNTSLEIESDQDSQLEFAIDILVN